MTRRPLAARASGIATIAASTILAGCGGSVLPPLSMARLQTLASAACSSATTAEGRLTDPVNASQAAPFITHGLADLQREYEALSRLTPTGTIGTTYRRAVSAIKQELTDVHAASVQLNRGRDALSTIKALQTRLTPLENQADTAFTALQMSACLSTD